MEEIEGNGALSLFNAVYVCEKITNWNIIYNLSIK